MKLMGGLGESKCPTPLWLCDDAYAAQMKKRGAESLICSDL